MYKLMIETLDSGNEGFEIAGDFQEEYDAWLAWNDEADEWPEMVGVWVEKQSIIDEFGIEAAENTMNTADDHNNA